MTGKMLVVTVLSLVLIPIYGFAQSNEVGILVGGIQSPDTNGQPGVACPINDINCAVPNRTSTKLSYEGVVAHRIANLRLASFYLELPVVGIPDRTLRHTTVLPGTNNFFQSFSSIFFTPSLKLKLSGPGVSPFVSVGGGLAHFSPGTDSQGFKPSSSTTGAFQVGGGLDFKTPIPFVGLRGEVREFYTGEPDISTSRHNIFFGGGLVLHF